jgi:hypothetical protein
VRGRVPAGEALTGGWAAAILIRCVMR